MINFYQNSSSEHLVLLDFMLGMLAALEASLQLFPTPFQVCDLCHLGFGGIQMKSSMAKDEARFKIPIPEHEHKLSLLFFFSIIQNLQTL